MPAADAPVRDASTEELVSSLIRETAVRLDREDLEGWFELFAQNASYELNSYSPELRAQTVWWRADRGELEKQLGEVHEHVRDPARRLHLVTPMSVTIAGGQVTALSHFVIYRTLPSGESALFAVGRYEDEFVLENGCWRYAVHRAVLETRVLDAFTHLPL
jgi:3-phenylpropionate/cinnamic acid dioxygenase small subunit